MNLEVLNKSKNNYKRWILSHTILQLLILYRRKSTKNTTVLIEITINN